MTGCVPVTWLAKPLQVGRVSRPEGWGNVPWLSLGKEQPNEKDNQVTWHIHFFPICDGNKYGQIGKSLQLGNSGLSLIPLPGADGAKAKYCTNWSESHSGGECRRVSLSVCVFDWFQFETTEVISESDLEYICIYNLTKYVYFCSIQRIYLCIYTHAYMCRFNWLRTQNPFFCVM